MVVLFGDWQKEQEGSDFSVGRVSEVSALDRPRLDNALATNVSEELISDIVFPK